MSRLTKAGLWLLPWYPLCWVALLVWLHFKPDLPFDLLFNNHSQLFDAAVSAFGTFGWIAFYALILGLILLCIAGIRRAVRLRRQFV